MDLKDLINATVTLKFNTDKICEESKDLFFHAKLHADLKAMLTESTERSFAVLRTLLEHRFKTSPYVEVSDFEKDFECKVLVNLIDDQLEHIVSIKIIFEGS